MEPKVDFTGITIKTMDDGLIKIDGITPFKKIIRNGVIYIQFCDKDRLRSSCRGTRFVEIPLDVLFSVISTS